MRDSGREFLSLKVMEINEMANELIRNRRKQASEKIIDFNSTEQMQIIFTMYILNLFEDIKI